MGVRIAAVIFFFASVSSALSQTEPCEDLDQDGYLAGPGCAVQDDCNDQNSSIHPMAPELCDGWDNDCDWELDEGCNRTCPDFGVARRVFVRDRAEGGKIVTADRGWAVTFNSADPGWPNVVGRLNERGETITPWSVLADDSPFNVHLTWTGQEMAAAWSRTVSANSHGAFFRRLGPWGKPPMDELNLQRWSLTATELGWNGYEYYFQWRGNTIDFNGVRFARLNSSGDLQAPFENTVPSTLGGDIVWNGNGYGWIFHDQVSGTTELFFRNLDTGGFPAGEPVQLTDHSSPNPSGSVAPDYNISYIGPGQGYGVSWRDNRTGDWEVWFTRLDDSGQLMTPPGEVQVTQINRPYGAHSQLGMGWSGEEFVIVWAIEDIFAGPEHLIGTRVSQDGAVLEQVDLTAGPRDQEPRVAWNGKFFGVLFERPTTPPSGDPVIEYLEIGCNCSTDSDSDGVLPCSGGDCNDSDPDVGAGMNEICDDGKDNDCDGLVDCNDADCGQGGKDPGLVGGLGFSNKDTLIWDTDGNSDDYDIVRGAISDLKDMENYLWSECFGSRISGTTVSDTDTPSSGNGWYYQVRGHARTCLIGPWGTVIRDDTIRSCP